MNTRSTFVKSAIGVIMLFVLMLAPGKGWGQIIAWQLFGAAGNETTIAASTLNTNLNTSSLARGIGLNVSALANVFGSTNYTASGTKANAISANKYVYFTVNAKLGYKVSLSTLDARFRRSGTGPNAFRWQYSTDGSIYTDLGSSDISYTLTTTGGDAQVQIDLSGVTALQNVTNATTITIRLLGWGASATTGTFGIGRSLTNGATDFSLAIGGTVASSASASSDIISNASFTYPTNIAYNSYQGTSLTTGNSIEVAKFDIRDGGASADADALSTTLTALTLNVANPGSIRRIALFDGSSNVGEVAGGATAAFSGLTLVAADNASKTFSVRVSFLSSVTDNQQFSFTVNSATADLAGSTFAAANAGGAVTSTTGDNNRIEVTASDIIFVQNVSTVGMGAVMSPSPTLRAVDALGNSDLDYGAGFTVAVTTGTVTFDPAATTTGSFSSGLATLSNLKFNTAGTGNKITVTSGSYTDESGAFDVTNPLPEINVKQGATAIATGGTYDFSTQLSGSSSSAITFTVENLGSAVLNLNGTPIVAKSGTNASEFTIDQTLTTSTVGAGSSTTFTVTFHPASQGSKTAQLSIANDDATGSENPYLVNLTGTGTVSAASDIANTAGYSYTSNIAYASYQAAATLTAANSVGITGLTIRDGAGAADADNLGTTLTAISFTTGGSTAVRTAALFDGTTNLGEVAVNGATTITFSGLSITAADGGTKDFELRATFQSTVTDNQQITFTVSSATASVTGSGFATANAGGAASAIAGDDNRLEVTASKLNFVQQPSNSGVNIAMTPAVTVEAADANNNRDLDYATSITISSSGTLTGSPVTGTLANGLATFSSLTHTAIGSNLTLTAASGSFSNAANTTFSISSLLMVENFSYTASQAITANGWTAHSVAGTNAITVTSSPISYPGYLSSGIGNEIAMATSGEDDNKSFSSVNSGSLYASFIVNVASAQTTGDYFAHFGATSGATVTVFGGRIWIKKDPTTSNFAFGLSSKTSSSINYTGYIYSPLTTYLVVVKYSFIGGLTNDVSVLYINPTLNASEPSPTVLTTTTDDAATDPTQLTSFCLRQGNSSNAPILKLDGIRVSTNWADIVGEVAPPAAYAMTGNGGSYCAGAGGALVGLGGSQTGVNYTLIKNGTPTATIIAGTGSAISFGSQLNGTYTASGTSDGSVSTISGTTSMTGSAVITENALPTTATVGSNQTIVTSLTSASLGGNNPAGGETGTWSKQSGPGTVSFSPDIHNVSATATVSAYGTYVFRWTISNANCSTFADITVIYTQYKISIAAGSWNTGATWSPVGVPTATEDVVIAHAITIDNTPTAVCSSLTINSTKSLTVYPGLALSVNGTLTNNATESGLIIQSDATGTGSLINGTAGVPATVNRYITGTAASWHQLSSPVAAQAISGGFTPSGTYPDGSGYDFYAWYEQSGAWVNFKNTTVAPTWNTANGSTSFTVGKGYLVEYQAANPTLQFLGNLNTGAVSYGLLKSAAGTYAGYNFVGNPYASAMDWKAAGGWDRSKLPGDEVTLGYDMSIWNDAAGNYGSFNSLTVGAGTNDVTQYIPVGQGFMVKAASAGAFGMNNNGRVHNTQPFLKSADAIANILRLEVAGDANAYSDEIVVEFGHATASGGAEKMFSMYATAPSLYTVKPTGNYAIDFRGEAGATTIPVSFKAGVDGTYTITASQLESFTSWSAITLEDVKTSQTQNLKQNPVYTFTATTNDNGARFLLHFGGAFSVNDKENGKPLTIYSSGNSVFITSTSGDQLKGEVFMYNMIGQPVLHQQLGQSSVTKLTLTAPTGYYLVKVITSDRAFTTKVFVNN
ncbi:MAG: choice-of-anchor D domain-containing protein [Bacteroidetes bacterium]|nr:choice-of-anchor D domain-containing protein [Bacteroidota bacterium]